MSSQLHIAVGDEGSSTPIKVLYLKGDLDASTHKDVETKANELIGEGSTNILIDLGDVSYMGSAGLRALNSISKSVAESSGQFKLANPSESVSKVMKTLGFEQFFDIHDSVDTAIGNFR
ncbi:MAG: STAS domain-containing protein [Thioalkalispiraceae bacterium]|jgi:anti-sigma B factor antagonist/stage II sporulation protein AA (anti-sigma F factor antagonist)